MTAGGDGGGPCRGSGAEAYWDPGDQGRVSLVEKGLVFWTRKSIARSCLGVVVSKSPTAMAMLGAT